MVVFAEMYMWPGGLLAWIVVGLISGFLAGQVMKGSGYGIIGDILVGLIGAFVGGLVCSLLVDGVVGFWGSIAVSFVGACLLIALVRAIAPNRSRL